MMNLFGQAARCGGWSASRADPGILRGRLRSVLLGLALVAATGPARAAGGVLSPATRESIDSVLISRCFTRPVAVSEVSTNGELWLAADRPRNRREFERALVCIGPHDEITVQVLYYFLPSGADSRDAFLLNDKPKVTSPYVGRAELYQCAAATPSGESFLNSTAWPGGSMPNDLFLPWRFQGSVVAARAGSGAKERNFILAGKRAVGSAGRTERAGTAPDPVHVGLPDSTRGGEARAIGRSIYDQLQGRAK